MILFQGAICDIIPGCNIYIYIYIYIHVYTHLHVILFQGAVGLYILHVILFQGAVVKHACPPYALAWSTRSITAAGCDRRLQFYTHTGKVGTTFIDKLCTQIYLA